MFKRSKSKKHKEKEVAMSKDKEEFDSPDDVLQHYGIKGMKWGIRRGPEELRRARGPKSWENYKQTPKAKVKTAVTDARAQKYRKQVAKSERLVFTKTLSNAKPRSSTKMTDAELKRAVERLQLEREYNKLTADSRKTKFSTMKTFVGDVVSKSVKSAAQQQLTAALNRMFEQQRQEAAKQQKQPQKKTTPQEKTKTKTTVKETKSTPVKKNQAPQVTTKTVKTVKRIEGGELSRLLSGKTSVPRVQTVSNNPNIKTAQQLLEELQKNPKR